MQFLMMVKSSEAAMATNPPPPEFMSKMGRYSTEMAKKGVLVTSAGLGPSLHSSKVRMSKGKLTITDGPFTEAKEIVGGYAVLEARSKEHAIELASEFLGVHGSWPGWEGEVEIRPLMQMPPR
jgi:hypothetical protein